MRKVVAQSIFKTTVVERNWRNHITSGVVHAVVIALAFLIAVPAVIVPQATTEHVTLIAPVIPRYHPHIEAPRITHTVHPSLPPLPAPVVKVIPVPVLPKPQPKQAAKIISPPVVPVASQPRIAAELKPDLPPPPKPIVKTGSFQDAQLAKPAAIQKQLVVGGFGDPRGAQSSETPKSAPVLMAKMGAFENPAGAGQAGSSGHMDNGAIKQSGFGTLAAAGVPGANNKAASVRTNSFGDGSTGGVAHSAGTVRSTGFGDAAAAAAPQRRDVTVAAAAFTPVEILFKPRPSYSSEARDLRLEGQVSLEVIFQASGAVRVVRVIKGLGHGLDEAAQQAALQVRFKPATRSGAAVDTNATISITFELT